MNEKSPLRIVSLAAVSTRAQTDGVSLDMQIRDNAATAETLGGDIIDTLVVKGHSRRYSSLQDAADAMQAKDIDAFDRLIEHLKEKDFDLLICRDGNRFARKQSIFAEIVERIIEAGARVYPTLDGYMVDKSNYTMYIAMSGYRAAAEINENIKKQSDGRKDRLKKGLPEHRAPDYLIPVRDERTGISISYQHDPRWQPVWDALKIELLAGTSWRNIDFAISQPPHNCIDPATGVPFLYNKLRSMVYTPLFWGHVASGHRVVPLDKNDPEHNTWIFDDYYPPPRSVTVERHRFPAVFVGDDAALVIAELHRRQQIRGRASPQHSYRFAGLCCCGYCGYTMATHAPSKNSVRWHRRVRCASRFKTTTRPVCENKKTVRYDVIQGYLNQLLEKLLSGEPDEAFQMDSAASILPMLSRERDTLKNKIVAIIRAQGDLPEDAPAALRAFYSAEITHLGTDIETLSTRIRQVEMEEASQHTARAAWQHGITQLRALTLSGLWQMSETQINQALHAALGNWRLIIEDGQITRVEIVTGRRWSGAKYISMF